MYPSPLNVADGVRARADVGRLAEQGPRMMPATSAVYASGRFSRHEMTHTHPGQSLEGVASNTVVYEDVRALKLAFVNASDKAVSEVVAEPFDPTHVTLFGHRHLLQTVWPKYVQRRAVWQRSSNECARTRLCV
jgi:hypothetical protein